MKASYFVNYFVIATFIFFAPLSVFANEDVSKEASPRVETVEETKIEAKEEVKVEEARIEEDVTVESTDETATDTSVENTESDSSKDETTSDEANTTDESIDETVDEATTEEVEEEESNDSEIETADIVEGTPGVTGSGSGSESPEDIPTVTDFCKYDFNYDGSVGEVDKEMLLTAMGTDLAQLISKYDLSEDGSVNTTDLMDLLTAFGEVGCTDDSVIENQITYCGYDFNGNGHVDTIDKIMLEAAFDSEIDFIIAEFDINGDGAVDTLDQNIFNTYFDTPAPCDTDNDTGDDSDDESGDDSEGDESTESDFCKADFDNSGEVDGIDQLFLVNAFTSTDQSDIDQFDLDANSEIDIDDLKIFLTAFGEVDCENETIDTDNESDSCKYDFDKSGWIDNFDNEVMIMAVFDNNLTYDLNGDFVTDSLDQLIFNEVFGTEGCVDEVEEDDTEDDGPVEENSETVTNSNNGSGSSCHITGTCPDITNDGVVLGATTDTCEAFVSYMKIGSVGGEVSKLQEFLNESTDAGLVVDGIFGVKTEAAVHAFQAANFEETIDPWGESLSETTGNFFWTTRAWANELMGCGEGDVYVPGIGTTIDASTFVNVL